MIIYPCEKQEHFLKIGNEKVTLREVTNKKCK